MNHVTVSGQLDRDARLLQHDGVTFARLEICTLTTFQDPEGIRHQRLDTHPVVLFGALAEQVRDLKQGHWITVRGALRTCVFENEGGQLIGVEIVASGVETQDPPTFFPRRVVSSIAARLSRRAPRSRPVGSCRRGRPGREACSVHPVADEFLFDEVIAGFLQSEREAVAVSSSSPQRSPCRASGLSAACRGARASGSRPGRCSGDSDREVCLLDRAASPVWG